MTQRKTFVGIILGLGAIFLAGSQLIVHAGGRPAVSVGAVNFTAAVDYTVGTLPFANATGDFNGDHIIDIAVCNYSSNNVSVLLGRGDGTFETAVNYPVGTEPSAITVADLNHDGFPDIAVADEIGKTIAVLINKADGTGTFDSAVLYPAGQAPRGIVAGDLRGTGIVDLVVANNLGGDITVFLGNGDGTFKAGINYAADQNPKSVVLGYFSNNNILDIAVANHNTNDISILMGNGDGSFKAPVNYPVGLDPRHVLAFDFNKDGKLDLATANGGESTVSILYGNGDGTFQPQVKYTASTSPRWLAVADYNNDGNLDIATSNYDAKNVSILLGTGSSTAGQAFVAPQNYIVGSNPTGLVAGDFNGDGLQDIAVTIGGLPATPNTLMGVLLNVPVTVTPVSLVFPAQNVGTSSAPQVVTLTNGAADTLTITSIGFTGGAAADYSQTNNCGSALSGNSNCTINVTFKPKAINNRIATLKVVDSAAGGSQSVAITGVGTSASFSPTSLNFGTQMVGTTSAAQLVTLSNVGGATITVTAVGMTGTNAADFAQTNNCSAIPAKKTCTISVTFTPSLNGARTASLSVTDNGGGSPQTVPLSGTGGTPVLLAPTALNFPLQVLKTSSSPQLVTLSNNSSASLGISGIAFSGADPADFSQTNNCGLSLAGNSSCTINVTFTPANINHRAATMTVTDSVGSQSVTLAGTSTAASFSPTTLTFTAQSVGTSSAPQTITLTDVSGGSALSITALGITGADASDFFQTNNCGSSVGPKKSCTIVVTFIPVGTGTRSAALSVTDNGGGSPQTVPVTGTGQ